MKSLLACISLAIVAGMSLGCEEAAKGPAEPGMCAGEWYVGTWATVGETDVMTINEDCTGHKKLCNMNFEFDEYEPYKVIITVLSADSTVGCSEPGDEIKVLIGRRENVTNVSNATEEMSVLERNTPIYYYR